MSDASSGLHIAESPPATTPPPSPDLPSPELPTSNNEDDRDDLAVLCDTDEIDNISDLGTPPASLRPRKLMDLPPRLRAERAVARIEAAAYQSEAAASRLTRDAARMRAMADRAETAARCIGEHAEEVFGMMWQAADSMRLIGRQAESLVEVMEESAGPVAAATGKLIPPPLEGFDEGFDEWLAQQK
ncbi:hypothetical protein B0H15DRAFT_956258 [Mycena belliarum]|uniref:Uncharacterized protein n=1 Tax=Mycena belliarum TaxID=1033014 RepID=A0AAD6TUG0_9AGAR|nr:hypothetical protein B0H15DRAFT_956258 [Mycena belliae]